MREDATTLARTGDVLFGLGRYDEAVKAWLAALYGGADPARMRDCIEAARDAIAQRAACHRASHRRSR